MIKLFLGLSIFCAVATSRAEIIQVTALAVVGGKAITNTDVVKDIFVESPLLLKSSQNYVPSQKQLEQGLQRLITQKMVAEEYKIFGGEKAPDEVMKRELSRLRLSAGTLLWGNFMRKYELKDSDLRESLAEKWYLKQVLAQRSKQALENVKEPLKDEQKASLIRKNLEDWLEQLRGRYKVQILKTSS